MERERKNSQEGRPQRGWRAQKSCVSLCSEIPRAIGSLDVGGILLDLGTSTTCSHPVPTPATGEGKCSGPAAFPCLDHRDKGETVPGNQSLVHEPYTIDP